MGNIVIEANKRDVLVLPMNLKLRPSSKALVENINVDFQSSQSTTSLHDIAAYINQDPTRNNEG